MVELWGIMGQLWFIYGELWGFMSRFLLMLVSLIPFVLIPTDMSDSDFHALNSVFFINPHNPP